VIFGQVGNQTVEIVDSSYLVVSNLVIDGRGVFEPVRIVERSASRQ
jgi:hypothetical protein